MIMMIMMMMMTMKVSQQNRKTVTIVNTKRMATTNLAFLQS